MNKELKYPHLESLKNKAEEAFALPTGYFESFSSKIKTDVYLLHTKENSKEFNLPEGYFEELNEHILSQLNIQKLKIGEEPPKDYFKNLSATIFERIEMEELNKTPILNEINKQRSFGVPDNYFADLKLNIEEKIKEPKIILFNPQKNYSSFTLYKWAAAIIVTVVSAWFLVQYFNQNSFQNNSNMISQLQNESFEKMALQEIDESTLVDYLSIVNAEEFKQKETSSNISEEEIIQNIDINDLGDAL